MQSRQERSTSGTSIEMDTYKCNACGCLTHTRNRMIPPEGGFMYCANCDKGQPMTRVEKSGVMVEGMKMPVQCKGCPMKVTVMHAKGTYNQYTESRCRLTRTSIRDSSKRLENCPLKEVNEDAQEKENTSTQSRGFLGTDEPHA